MRVYERVRAYIDDNGLKQIAVAQKAGIPKATFNAILNGKRTLYADDLRAICLALNVSPEMFIDVCRGEAVADGRIPPRQQSRELSLVGEENKSYQRGKKK